MVRLAFPLFNDRAVSVTRLAFFFTSSSSSWDQWVVSVLLNPLGNDNIKLFLIRKQSAVSDRAVSATQVTLFFTPLQSVYDQCVVFVLLISSGNVNINRFLIKKHFAFSNRAACPTVGWKWSNLSIDENRFLKSSVNALSITNGGFLSNLLFGVI